jgi:hypothetical protein
MAATEEGYQEYQSPILFNLLIELKGRAEQRILAINEAHFSSGNFPGDLLNDYLTEQQQNDLQAYLVEYYKRFIHQLMGTLCWSDLKAVIEMSIKPFPWSQHENLPPMCVHIAKSEIDDFFEEAKQAFWYQSETKDRFKNIDWTNFQDDSVLFTNDELILRIRKRMEMIDNATKNVDHYKVNPISWSDFGMDASQLLMHPSLLKLNKSYFLLKIKEYFSKDGDFAWHFDFSRSGLIQSIPRERNIFLNG